MDSSPNLSLPYIMAAQAQKHVTHNEAVRALDALVQLMVLDKDLATPPGSPTDGSRYIVAASPTGAWAGQAGKIAAWQDGTWEFFAPREGWLAWVADEDKLYFHDGSAWAVVTVAVGSGAAIWGINTTADSTNRLSVKSTASLFDNVGNGHQQKINKNAAADTASQLFQTNYSGRAELGLTGDDDFHVKVSADGSTWKDAVIVDRTSGAARLPNTAYLDLPAGSAPTTPATGKVRLYAKSDKSLYQKDDAGTETGLAGGGSGSSTVVAPQGRLTLASGIPVLASDTTGAATVYYTPCVGRWFPYYDGTTWNMASFSEISLALDSNSGHTGYHQSGKNFDLFIDYNGGSPRLVSGPAWTNDTTRADAITRLNGIWVNNASITVRFGTSSGDTASISASRLTYAGTFRATANGQTGMAFRPTAAAGGTDNVLGLYNAYNRRPVTVLVRDSNASWSYGTGTWRPFDGASSNTKNRFSWIDGLQESAIFATLPLIAAPAAGSVRAGINLDSTTATPDIVYDSNNVGIAASAAISMTFTPQLGFHYVQAMEYANGGSQAYLGVPYSMLMGLLEM